MQVQDLSRLKQVDGHVKWFDPAKGFGFVVAPDGGPDILLHANVLRNFGQGSVVDGSGISIVVQDTQRGLQAVEVVSISPPVTDDTPPLRDLAGLTRAEIDAIEIQPARVKWYDKAKGFGFANIFGQPQDVFMHIDVLRRSGLADLQSGEAIGIRVAHGERGLMAVELVGWEAANT